MKIETDLFLILAVVETFQRFGNEFFDIPHIVDTSRLFYGKPQKFFLADYIYHSYLKKGGGGGGFGGGVWRFRLR